MRTYSFLTFILILFCSGCKPKVENDRWAESTATILNIERLDGMFTYTIEYPIPESTAINQEGKRIVGPIQQHGMLKKKPLDGQRLKMRYLTNDPVIFELLEPIKYE